MNLKSQKSAIIISLILCLLIPQLTFGKTDKKLIQRIRVEFQIPEEEVSDDLMKKLLSDDTNLYFLSAIIQQIDFGNCVNSWEFYIDESIELFKFFSKKYVFAAFEYLLQNYPLFHSGLSVFQAVFIIEEGVSIYKKLAAALVKYDLLSLAIDYKDGRLSGKDVNETWKELYSVYDPIIEKILELKNVNEESLKNYFEIFYYSWRVANIDGENTTIRQFILDELNIITPHAIISPSSDFPGTIFHIKWTGFTPQKDLEAFIEDPSGNLIFKEKFRTNSLGESEHDFNSTGCGLGVYTHWAVDKKAGISTENVTFKIRDNSPPDAPSITNGPSQGNINTNYDFTAFSTDPDGDNIEYQFNWGDGDVSSWGSTSQAHSWTNSDLFEIKVKARDSFEAESAWSIPHVISIEIPNLEYTVIISSNLGGTTTPLPGKYNYIQGTAVVITAIPDIGNSFAGWDGNVPSGQENVNPVALNVDQNIVIQANFNLNSSIEKWPMFMNNSQNTGQSPFSGPVTADVKWTYTITENYTGGGLGNPILGDDDTVYIGSGNQYSGVLHAIDMGGNLKWTSPDLGACPSNAAIASDGTIIVGTWDNGYNLYALYPENGTEKWKFYVGDRIDFITIGGDDIIYFTSETAYLYALYLSNGNLKWQYNIGNFTVSHSCPAIGQDGTVYVSKSANMGISVYAIDTDGILKWFRYFSGGQHYSSVSISEDDLLYLVTDSTLFCVNPANGYEIWSKSPGEQIYSKVPTLANDDRVMFITKKDLWIYDSQNGLFIGKYQVSSEQQLTPTDCTTDKEGAIYVGFEPVDYASGGAKIISISKDGSERWSIPLLYVNSHPVISNGIIYFVALDNNSNYKVYAIGPKL